MVNTDDEESTDVAMECEVKGIENYEEICNRMIKRCERNKEGDREDS